MAAAFLHAFAQGRITVLSAIADRSAPLDPGVVEVMAEAGIHDLEMYAPAVLTRGLAQSADFTVALNCAIDGLGRVDSDWRLLDPAGKPLDEIRAMRDEIRAAADALAKRFLDTVTSAN
jgi:arsenate reductase